MRSTKNYCGTDELLVKKVTVTNGEINFLVTRGPFLPIFG